MKEKASQAHHRGPKWLKALTVYFTSIVAILVVIGGIFSVMYSNRIYPRVAVAGVMVGGLSKVEASQKLAEELPKLSIKPVILTIDDGRSFTILPNEIEATYDAPASAEAAFLIGRGQDLVTTLSQKITSPILGIEVPAKVKVKEEAFSAKFESIVSSLIIPEKDAGLLIKEGVASITSPVTGQSINSSKLKQQVLDELGKLENEPIAVVLENKEPQIKEEAVAEAQKQATAVMTLPIVLTYEAESFTATPAIIGRWLDTKPFKTVLGHKLELYFNEEKIGLYIESLATKIDAEPKDARLALANNQLIITQASQDGRKLKREIAKADIVRLLTIRKELPIEQLSATLTPVEISPTLSLDSTNSTSSPAIAENQVVLEIEIKKPDVTNANINQLGIKERLAVATTDFKNSPANRQENIRLGAKLFNGVILSPGEEFSAVKSLGRIDESAGFKPELVIKQDQLTPEVGGGLCQVSTTLFRAVLNGGLEVTDRKNHRFRVSYYEARPADPDPEDYVTLSAKTLVGLDATIYDPSPDFKFKNDTANSILIQGKVEGTRLTFELFGTKDGRRVTIDGPYITSTIPAPTDIKFIDDPTLPSGVTKVKERPAPGAKTSFNYRVEKEGKELHKKSFTSSYVPWQAKHYRGTGAATSPSPDPSATPLPTLSPDPAAVSPSPTSQTTPTVTPTP